MLVGVSLAPSYRVLPDIAVGLRGGMAIEVGSPDGGSGFVWNVGLTGQYQAVPGNGAFVAVEAGLAVLGQHIGDSDSATSPQVGAALGYDFRTQDTFALAPELRVQWLSFGGVATGASESIRYKEGVWVGLSLVARFLL